MSPAYELIFAGGQKISDAIAMQHIQETGQETAKTPAGSAERGICTGTNSRRGRTRSVEHGMALQKAIHKRENGVPSYSVAEAAMLLSVSPEYLHRMIKLGAMPAVQMKIGGARGRYLVPAKAVEQILDHAVTSGDCVDAAEWTEAWRNSGGVA